MAGINMFIKLVWCKNHKYGPIKPKKLIKQYYNGLKGFCMKNGNYASFENSRQMF